MAQLAMVKPIDSTALDNSSRILKRRSYSGDSKMSYPLPKRSKAFLDDIMYLDPYHRFLEVQLQEKKLRNLDRIVAEKRVEAHSLWSQGLLEESLAEMAKSETILAKLVKEIRSLVLVKCHMMREYELEEQDPVLDDDQEDDDTKPRKSRKRVQFSEVAEVMGSADPQVDREPINVDPAPLAERLLIRCARELPMGPNMMGKHL